MCESSQPTAVGHSTRKTGQLVVHRSSARRHRNLTFMGSRNKVLWPLLVVRDEQTMTLPQLLTVFMLGGGAGTLGVSLAAAMVLVVPVVMAYMFLQRYFIESVAGVGVKG